MSIPKNIIDIHTHVCRNVGSNDIYRHTKLASESGIKTVVYMANCQPPLDNYKIIEQSLKERRYSGTVALPVGAITIGLQGKKLVDVESMKNFVVAFSDDGKCVSDLSIIKDILKMGVPVWLHLEPEVEYVEKVLTLQADIGGLLHLQHISRAESIEMIRQAKKSGIKVTCETCPHYIIYNRNGLDTKVNPLLGSEKDRKTVEEALSEGTIDVWVSDFAPKPRKTGIASFKVSILVIQGLARMGIITEKQLWDLLHTNPKKIIENGGYKF